jgi:SAM-dependent methyltransferase
LCLNDGVHSNLTIANIEKDIPYPDRYFDVVVMCEVIEHLVHDYNALENIRRVLKEDGILILSIPFLNDCEPTHIRIFNRKSAIRLLNASGFIVDKVLERPNLFFIPSFINFIHHAINAFFFILFKTTLYKYTLPFLWRLEKYFSQKKNPVRRYFSSYGGILVCHKGETLDYVTFNRQRFGGE